MVLAESQRNRPPIEPQEPPKEMQSAVRNILASLSSKSGDGVEAGTVYRTLVREGGGTRSFVNVIKTLLFFEQQGVAKVTIGNKEKSAAAPRYYKLVSNKGTANDTELGS